MCGIAGVLGLADRSLIARMVAAQAHRGPDDEGIYLDETNQVALGHRRLAIIDPSSAGHQPMSYANGRYWIIHNGEVYNFADIRAELEKLGHSFHSNTDTEVILAAYAQWGEQCLQRFRGMFAFAIWDSQQQNLFLARDRFGIKPLYYAQVNGVFLFASELKGMLASGLVERRLDAEAIWLYLSLSSVPPPHTMLAQVKALLPGHWMRVRDNHVEIQQYWDLERPPDDESLVARMAPQEIERELRRLLDESTRLRMIADVPVGAFLSGGIDSTAVVGLMSQYVSQPLKTYSIGFEGRGRRLSELPWAKVASERFGTDHHEIIVNGEDVAREFGRLIEAIDQPSGDGVNTYFVSKHARTGVTVALSGLGGDELFAGYPYFRWFQQIERLPETTLRLVAPAARIMQSVGPRRWRKLAHFVAAGDLGARHATTRCLYDEREKQALLAPPLFSDQRMPSLADFYRGYLHSDLDVVARTSYVETSTYMTPTLLRDTDAMSMAYALEVRVPLLDHKFAEFAFAIPPNLKLDGRQTKAILVRSLRDLLPEATVTRRKMGFEFPLGDWLAGPLQERVMAVLTSAEAQQLFRPRAIERMLQQAQSGQGLYARVWVPLVLAAWMQRHRCGL